MKIIICGEPKTGKTTLCKELKKKMPDCNLIVSEAIRNGFQKMDSAHSKLWGTKTSRQRTEDFPAFLKEFLEWNEEFTQNNSIVDLALLGVKDVGKVANEEDIVICLGFGAKTNEQIFEIIRHYEGDSDYTKTLSNEKLLSLWGDVAKQDLFNKQFCEKNGYFYINTSSNREKLVNKVISLIDEHKALHQKF